MNESEVLQHITYAIYHYVKQNNETFNNIEGKVYIYRNEFFIKDWPFQFPEPTMENLKQYTLQDVLNTWKDKEFADYFGSIESFFKYYHHYINKRLSNLEGNPEPTEIESNTLLQQVFDDFKTTQ